MANNFQKGVSFLEAIVAIFIFTVGFVGLLQVFIFSFGVEISNQRQSQATFLAEEKIENLLALPYEDVTTGFFLENTLPDPSEKFSRKTTIIFLDNALQQSLVDNGLKKITVEVSWNSLLSASPKIFQLSTIIVRK